MDQDKKEVINEIRTVIKQNMLVNLGLILLGAVVTMLTYIFASDGGTYVLAWGPIVFGAIGLLKNIYLYLNPKSLLDDSSEINNSEKGLNKSVSRGKSLLIIAGSVIAILMIATFLTSQENTATPSNTAVNSTKNTTPVSVSNNSQTIPIAPQLDEVESGDIYREINARRTSKGLSELDYSVVLQNIAQNLAIFNYQNPSLPIGETVLQEYFNGQEYYPTQSAYQALTDISCYLEPVTIVDRWYASANNFLDQRFNEIGIYIGVNDRNDCNIFLTLARP